MVSSGPNSMEGVIPIDKVIEEPGPAHPERLGTTTYWPAFKLDTLVIVMESLVEVNPLGPLHE